MTLYENNIQHNTTQSMHGLNIGHLQIGIKMVGRKIRCNFYICMYVHMYVCTHILPLFSVQQTHKWTHPFLLMAGPTIAVNEVPQHGLTACLVHTARLVGVTQAFGRVRLP